MRPTPSTQHRDTKRGAIVSFFVARLREEFRSNWLHGEFGSAFRTRVSELNADTSCPITIRNRTDENDESVYWAEPRHLPKSGVAEELSISVAPTNQVALSPSPDGMLGLPSIPESSTAEEASDSLFGDISPEAYPD